MKRILSVFACMAVMLSACQKEQNPSEQKGEDPTLSFETATYVMGADDAVKVKVVVSEAPGTGTQYTDISHSILLIPRCRRQ